MTAFKIPEMEDGEFSQWQNFLELKTGTWLPVARKPFLLASLNKHMREMGIDSYQSLFLLLNTGKVSGFDWAKIVDSLTVHETCFYRDEASLKLVSNFCRNRVQKYYRVQQTKPQQIQIWSVGCSTGEETYSLAIEMDKLNFSLTNDLEQRFYYGVTGMDVSYPSLTTARAGKYKSKKLEHISRTTINHYFENQDKFVQVKENIRDRTCFIYGNVLDLGKKKHPDFDVIYCQNVMIYFRQEVKNSIIKNLIKNLKPGGMLVLGHGELGNLESDYLDSQNLVKVDNKDCLAFIKNEEFTDIVANKKFSAKNNQQVVTEEWSCHDGQL